MISANRTDAAYEAFRAHDRRNGGRFPAAWLLQQSDQDLKALYGWLVERFDAARTAERQYYMAGLDASAKYWRMTIRTHTLLRQRMQVSREQLRRLGMDF